MENMRSSLSNKIKSAGRLNEITYKFKVLDTDELRVMTILRIMEMFDTIPEASCKVKDTKNSIDLRSQANRMFGSSKNDVNELLKTWEMYSKSIALAQPDSPELSLAYANRSAILIKLHKYAECIEDIDRALKLEYPERLRGKLLCRKIECFKCLNKTDLLNDALDEAKLWLERMTLSSGDKATFEQKLKRTSSANCAPLTKRNSTSVPSIVSNKIIPCASEALTVKRNDKFGRHVVTTRDVRPGEILVVEKIYAKVLFTDEAHAHCSHCLRLHWSLIPCQFCVFAMYCSENCQKEAWVQYHDVECCVTGYLVDLGFKKQSLLAVRLAIVALREAADIRDFRDTLTNAQGSEDFAVDKPYLSDSYVNLYNLVTNTDKRSVTDLFEKALNAGVMVYYLCTLTNFFGKKFTSIKDMYMDEDVTFIGGLILRHLQIIPCNIHSYEEERNIEIVDIGAAALPFCSLINHSCDPNVFRCTTSNHTIVFALVPIKKGCQIYDNYGSHYAVMSKMERQSKLKQYYFDCHCEPCESNWPMYKRLPSYTQLLTDKEVIRKIKVTLEKLDNYIDWAKEDQIDDKAYLISDLVMMIETLTEHSPLPFVELNNVVETLKRVLILTYGNKFEFPKI